MQLIAAYQTSTNPSSWPPPSPTSSRSSLKTAGKVRSGGRGASGVGKSTTKSVVKRSWRGKKGLLSPQGGRAGKEGPPGPAGERGDPYQHAEIRAEGREGDRSSQSRVAQERVIRGA